MYPRHMLFLMALSGTLVQSRGSRANLNTTSPANCGMKKFCAQHPVTPSDELGLAHCAADASAVRCLTTDSTPFFYVCECQCGICAINCEAACLFETAINQLQSTCPPVRVPYASVMGGVDIGAKRQEVGTKADVTCNNGHFGSITCQPNGEWFPMIPACAACPLNLIYAVENGVTVNEQQFSVLKQKLQLLTMQFPIGVGKSDKRKSSVAIVTYSASSRLVSPFSASASASDVLFQIEGLTVGDESGTNTSSALSDISTNVMNDDSRQQNGLMCKRNVLLLFAWNEHSGADAGAIANHLRRYQDVVIVAVGFNESLQRDLEKITGGADRVILYSSVDAMNVTKVTDIFRTQCIAYDEKKAIKACNVEPVNGDDKQGQLMCAAASHTTGCETIDDGDSNYNTTTFKCTCAPGWTCDLCDEPVDRCENPAAHCAHFKAGSCENCDYCSTAKNVVCTCKDGWLTDWLTGGTQCSVDIDECASQPCEHGAECVNLPGGFECNCTHGWSGPRCEHPLGCADPSVECAKGAVCLGGVMCKCSEGTGNPYVSCSFNADHKAESYPGEPRVGVLMHTFDDAVTLAPLATNCPITIVRPCSPFPNIPQFKVVYGSADVDGEVLVNRVFVLIDDKNNVTFIDGVGKENRMFLLNGESIDLHTAYKNRAMHIDEVSLNVYSVHYGALVLRTDFSLGVDIGVSDGRMITVAVTMPRSTALEGRLCGVAGNMNAYAKDDLLLRDGSEAKSRDEFVDDWATDSLISFAGVGCLLSREFASDKYWAANQSVCRHISDINSPFGMCLKVIDEALLADRYKLCARALIENNCEAEPEKCNQQACSDHLEPLGQLCREKLLDIGVSDWIWSKAVGCPDPACPQPETMEWDPYAVACQPTCDCPDAQYRCPIEKPQPRCVCTGNDATHTFVFRDRSYSECVNLNECEPIPEEEKCKVRVSTQATTTETKTTEAALTEATTIEATTTSTEATTTVST